ncbi:NAD(P)-dependent oxidoreductase, partial [Desertihabitans aurantiacus]|uniref:NAD(P)-dependent oxidoreductase n=1 Tax=Desertihabitans aurantiacus TaxID=2282477 RepID=UPI002FCDE13D
MELQLAGRPVLVAGGGPRAAALALDLLDRGAAVTVLARDACEDVTEPAAEGRLRWLPRDAGEDDLDGCWLLAVATGSAGEDARLL